MLIMSKSILNLADKIKTEPMRVLIADDDPPTRILLRAAISQWGYSVVEAADGEEAWKLLNESAVQHLVILDWVMPKLDGLDVCRKIVNDLPYRPYIILLTQVSGTENIIKGLEGGADEFLSKPFNMAELRSRLSVGARIINYKMELDKKCKQLQSYISNLEFVATLTADIRGKVDEFAHALASIKNTDKNTIVSISEIKNKVDQLADVINKFQLNEITKNDEHER
jgi:DNA-binding response OmpR family regulator